VKKTIPTRSAGTVKKSKTLTKQVQARVGKRAVSGKAPVLKDDADSIDSVLLETAQDMYTGGLMGKAALHKITMRHAGHSFVEGVDAISGEQIREMRERANMSQGVFARFLNVTSGYVSQLERGDKQPKGATLKLLDVIKRKGIDPLM
jgi:putative transcriptional regulator